MSNIFIQKAIPKSEDFVAFEPTSLVNGDRERMETTISRLGNAAFPSGAMDFRQPQVRWWRSALSVVGNRIGVTQVSDYNSRPVGWLDGGTVTALRVTDVAGKPTWAEVGSTTITATNARPKTQYSAMASKSTIIPVGTSAQQITFPNYYQDGGQLWYQVASVSSVTGNVSNWSAAATVNVPNNPQDVALTNNEVTPTISVKETVVDGALAVPSGVAITTTADPNLFTLSWTDLTGSPNVAGVIVRSMEHDPAVSNEDNSIDVVDGSIFQATDMLLIEKTFPLDAPLSTYRSVRMTHAMTNDPWTPFARLADDVSIGPATVETLETESGEGYLHLVLPSGSERNMQRICYGGESELYYTAYQAGATYAVRLNLEVVSGSVLLSLGNGDQNIPVTPDVNGDFVYQWVPTAGMLSGSVTGFTLKFVGPVEVNLHQLWSGRDDVAPFALTPEDKVSFERFAPHALRTHNFPNSQYLSMDISKLTDKNGRNGFGLAQQFLLAKEINDLEDINHPGAQKYTGVSLQWPSCFTAFDLTAMMEYIAAPYDPGVDTKTAKPWAYKRYMQGYGPLVDMVPHITLEDGNEKWNTLSAFYAVFAVNGFSTGQVSGALTEFSQSVIQSSPYWPSISAKTNVRVGGWTNSRGWNEAVLSTADTADTLVVTAYNGSGWEEGPGEMVTFTPEYIHGILQGVESRWKSQFAEFNEIVDLENIGRAKPLRFGGYEQNNSTPVLPSSGVDRELVLSQELAWKCVAAQTAFIDQTLQFSCAGAYCQNFFIYGIGANWNSRTESGEGAVDVASWRWLGLINREMSGPIGEMRIFTSPTTDITDNKGAYFSNLPQVTGYLAQDGAKRVIALVNRRIPNLGYDFPTGDGVSDVYLRIAGGATSKTVWTMSGAWNESNITQATKNNLQISSVTTAIDPALQELKVTLQPGSFQLIKLT